LLARKADSDTMPPIRARKKQAGCVRFSYVPRDARVPRRYRCQPDLAIAIAVEAARKEKPEIQASLLGEMASEIALRMQPTFTNLRFGHAAYGQLARSTPIEIRSGAEDEAEMGAFRTLYQLQRETNLRVRLDEYLRFGMEAGIFYAT
jgi:hypothetical protein